MRALSRGSGIAMALVGILLACDKSPTQPTTFKQPSQQPPPPTSTPKTLTSITMSGPSSIAPDQTGQFTLTARYSDGSSEDVTKSATWRTGFSTVLTITNTGLATGHDMGETFVNAVYSSRSTTRGDVIVVPDGTFRVSGRVRDAGTSVAGANVRVMSGPTQGLNVTTAAGGTYKLYGVTGDSELRVQKDGYEDARRRLIVTQTTTADFDLVLTKPRDNVAGSYSLRVTAAPECDALLPTEARQRTFTAVISQNGPALQIVLQGASFVRIGNSAHNVFFGVVEPNRVLFQPYGGSAYYGFYYYYPDVIEELTPATWYTFGGQADTTALANGRSGPLDGAIAILDAVRKAPIKTCTSKNHRFELTR